MGNDVLSTFDQTVTGIIYQSARAPQDRKPGRFRDRRVLRPTRQTALGSLNRPIATAGFATLADARDYPRHRFSVSPYICYRVKGMAS